jgi:hypothetical protein
VKKTLLGAVGLTVTLSALIAGVPAFSAPAFSAPLGAAARIPTSTTVTALDPSVVSGKPLVFIAQVSPAKVGKTKLSGTVTWILRGKLGGHVACTVATPVTRGGKSKCRIAKDTLRSGRSPMAVTAMYSGDPNFTPSSGSTTQELDPAVTRVRILIPVKPTSDASTLVQAYVKGGPGTSLLIGKVTFVITSGLSRHGIATTCEGTSGPTTANGTRPVIAGLATCTLRAGWILDPPSTGPHSSSRTAWSITATYDGSESFTPSASTKTGRAVPPLT